jgi:CheY-like chemotaxis protein
MADTPAKKIVLIVEDEPLLRMNAVDFLTDAGFETLEAADATEAVRILESRVDVTLVFTDVDMPGGINGSKLAALIRNRWPPIEIVVTSGFGTPSLDSLPVRCVFFPKPYRAEAIVDALRRFAG